MKGVSFLSSALAAAALAAAADVRTVAIEDGERWWGAANYFGLQMPFTRQTELKIDLRRDNYHNQCASLLLSDKGRVVFSAGQSEIEFKDGSVTMDSDSEVFLETAGDATLRGAYTLAMRRWFPPSGKSPDPLFFTSPQLNTWIELTYRQNQADILAYAKSMLAHGIEPGVIMIDDTWQAGYGDWRFEPSRFPDPKAMMDELHALGYKVMLWMCPYVGMDSQSFRRVEWGSNLDSVTPFENKGGFLKEVRPPLPGEDGPVPTGHPKACRWWNGYSALLDFSHPNANAWFSGTLDSLVRDFGVDGFKLDGGDLASYVLSDRKACDPGATSGSLNNGYCSYALKYPFCEIRNTWKMQQMPVVVRLHDKPHAWEALGRITADMIGAGLLGQPFICPDMVGGGWWTAFLPGAPFDGEFFIRSAEIHALCPMMQISASPWRVLDEKGQSLFSEVVSLRQRFAPYFAALAEKAGKDGEPILRSLEYEYPGQGYAEVKDEFLMGGDLLVAPVLEKGVSERSVALPPGKWLGSDGVERIGPAKATVPAPLGRPAYFIRAGGCIGLLQGGAPSPQNVPELMVTSGGKRVESVEDWEKIRAPELLGRFSREVYGSRPPAADERERVSFEVEDVREAMDGKAVRKLVRVKYAGPGEDFSFRVTSFIPKSGKPAPSFILLCNRDRSNVDPDRTEKSGFWPAEEIVERGYAAIAVLHADIAADSKNAGFSQGIFKAAQKESERDPESWATISAWAWAASRAMDWIETEPLLDPRHVGVVGHSRGGKTAIWAGVTDKRFAMVCSNDSGCSGAKLNHIDLPASESIAQITDVFPYWFCENYRKYAGRDKELDFDNHELLALVAPRLLCVASASMDAWAGQRGEWWAARLASPAWELYGKKGLDAQAFPAPESPQQEGCVSYHLRTGKHDLTPYDWSCYMDFADRHQWR